MNSASFFSSSFFVLGFYHKITEPKLVGEPVLILFFLKKNGLMANQTENNHLFSTKIARPGYLAMHLSFFYVFF
jgi:hypothetical protein